MSTAAVGPQPLWHEESRPELERPVVRVCALLTVLVASGLIAVELIRDPVQLRHVDVGLIPWILVVAVANVLPLWTGRGPILSMDLPVLLSAGFIFGPAPAGLIALIGSLDVRELRGEVTASLAIWNRAQTALSAMAAALAFHALGALGRWPRTGLAAVVALAADCIVNYSLVALGVSLIRRRPYWRTLTDLRFGSRGFFIGAYLSFGFLGVLMAEAYKAIGFFGVLSFVSPIFLAREAFSQRRRLDTTLASLRFRSEALRKTDERIAEERRDERLVMAGELHDEVIPPLFQVHLMGQVIRQDLDSGRLLDLDSDVPELLAATQVAQSAVRSVVRDLRSSSLGPAGLNSAIKLQATQLESAGGPRFELELVDVGGSKLAQLLVYQVAREAMSNAARHSRARRVRLRLWREEALLRVLIEDDGVGFDSSLVDQTDHFGLQFTRERIEAAGGRMTLDSRLGVGTCVVAAIPADA